MYLQYLNHMSQHIMVMMFPDNKVHGANMGPTWVLSAPDGPHVGPMGLLSGFWWLVMSSNKFRFNPEKFLLADRGPQVVQHLKGPVSFVVILLQFWGQEN